MELEQLHQVEAVARLGTVSAAARELHMSQPALSRSIQRLETEIGASLFDRLGRRVELNDVGRVVLEWTHELMRDEHLMLQAVSAAVQRSRALRVASVAPAPVWRLTSLLVERFPAETLTSEMMEGDAIMRGVSEGSLDLGIVLGSPRVPGLARCELMRESLSVTLPPSHPLASRRELSFADLAGETFLILSEIGFWREVVDREIPGATYIEQRDRMVFDQLSYATPYCTFVSDAPFQRDPVPGRTVVPISDPSAHAVFSLVSRADASGLTGRLFSWVSEQNSTSVHNFGIS